MKNFTEFFAGVGLVRKGLEELGWSCQWANDISPTKMEIYNKNFNDNHFYLGDIWDIVNQINLVPNDTFLYTASFPCTDLSVAGGRAGLAGANSGTLNALFEILLKKKDQGNAPKIVLLENVKGFLTSHKGQDISNTIRNFTELEYCVDIIELDAIYFTPQSRPRVFIIAVSNEIAEKVMTIKQPENILDNYWQVFSKAPTLRSRTVEKVVRDNEDLKWGAFDLQLNMKENRSLPSLIEEIPLSSDLWWSDERKTKILAQMNERHRTTLDKMIEKEELSYGTVYRRVRNGKSVAEMRSDGVAGCLRTPKGGSSKQIIFQAGHNDFNVRFMTVREYARLQGVDDKFLLPESTNGYFAMGDAVCVPVIKYIAENILNPAYAKHNI